MEAITSPTDIVVEYVSNNCSLNYCIINVISFSQFTTIEHVVHFVKMVALIAFDCSIEDIIMEFIVSTVSIDITYFELFKER